MLLREFFEAVGTEVAIIFGRFNPAHKGHKAAWETAAKSPIWYVGTNKSTVGPKDPLPFDVKVKVMETIWPKVASHIVAETSWLTMASMVYEKHKASVLYCCTDEDWVTKTIIQYNGKEGPHGYYNFPSIEQKPTPRLSSATDLRTAVMTGDRDAFTKAAGVSAEVEIDGMPFFDLVAKYLLPYADTKSGKSSKASAKLKEVNKAMSIREGEGQRLSIEQLAHISDEALDAAYHYGRSTPGNTFGWQANLKSAEFAKRVIDSGETDIEIIADAIHDGWNVTARAFVQNPGQFDDTEKLIASGKLDAKIAQREKLMNISYDNLPDDEQEKDRVVARALLTALKPVNESLIDPGPETKLQASQIKDMLNKGMAKLNPREQFVVYNVVIKGQSYAKTGLAMGRSSSRVEQIFHKAISKLRYDKFKNQTRPTDLMKNVDKTDLGLLEALMPKKNFAGSYKLGPAAHLTGKMKRPAKRGDLVGGAMESQDTVSPVGGKKGTGPALGGYDMDAMRRATGTMEDLLDERKMADLYHSTDAEFLPKILAAGQLNPGRNEYISLTRDKRYNYGAVTADEAVQFVIDQAKLAYNRKIEPYDWHMDADDDNDREAWARDPGERRSESEERVKGPLSLKYVKEIQLPKGWANPNTVSNKYSDLGPKDKINIINTIKKMGIKISFTNPGREIDEVSKVKLGNDPDDFGAWVRDSGTPEKTVMLPSNKIHVFEPDSKFDDPQYAKNLANIVKAIKAGKQLPPILVRRHGIDRFQVVDGHHRFKAYRMAGMKSIPARVIDPKNVKEI